MRMRVFLFEIQFRHEALANHGGRVDPERKGGNSIWRIGDSVSRLAKAQWRRRMMWAHRNTLSIARTFPQFVHSFASYSPSSPETAPFLFNERAIDCTTSVTTSARLWQTAPIQDFLFFFQLQYR